MSAAQCNKCFLKAGHPGVTIDDDGLCNFCRFDIPDEIRQNMELAHKNYDFFEQSSPRQEAEYDCLFMYSGGKDSTYMLDKFVNEQHRRVLSYTFKIPFESKNAADNLDVIRQKIDTHYHIDTADDQIKRLMQHVFNDLRLNRPAKYLDEKLPCMTCRSFFVIRAIIFAFNANIPFIVFCADPQQIMTIESDVRRTVANFYNLIGQELTKELFGNDIEEVLFADPERLPKIIFPMIPFRHNYDPEHIVRELKEKGMYSASPLETHCTLFPLLNYYSFINHDCSFYKLNMSSQARKGDQKKSTFSITFGDNRRMLEVEDRYKAVVLDIAAGGGSKEDQLGRLRQVFSEMEFSRSESEYLVEQFMEMANIAVELGIKLKPATTN